MKFKHILIGLLLVALPLNLYAGIVINTGGSAAPVGSDFSGDANLQGWWNFEEALTDGSGEGNTLSVGAGSLTYSTTNCVHNGTYSGIFNGSTHLSRAGNLLSASFPGIAASSAMTVGCWYRATDATAAQGILTKGTTSLSWYIFQSADGNPVFCVTTDGSTQVKVTGATVFADNTDYFVVGVWDGAKIYIYVGTSSIGPHLDATPVAFSSTLYTNNDATVGQFYAGCGYFVSGFNFYLTGNIDDIGVFNTNLSYNDIYSWWENGLNNSH